MKGKQILLLILIVLINMNTGCWNRREINELSIGTAVGIDKSEDGYLVTVQLINPGEVASEKATERTAVTTYRASGETVFEALRKLTLETPRKIYLAHIRILVFGEEFAKEGIGKALDFISRDHEFRTDFYILIAKNTKAEKLLNVLTPVEQIPANKVFTSLKISEKAWASTYHVQLDELISGIISEGKNPVLTGVIIKGDPETGMNISNLENVDPPTTIQIRYIGVFKDDKLIGWLNEDESRGYNYIMDHVSSTIVNVPCENGKVGIELIRTKAKINGDVEYGKPKIDIKIWVEGNVGDVECEVDLTKTKNIYALEAKVQKKIKKEIESAIKKAQDNFKSDIFGFGEAIHRAAPKAWKELKTDWDRREFQDLEVNINVTVKIRRIGTIMKSFQKEAKE